MAAGYRLQLHNATARLHSCMYQTTREFVLPFNFYNKKQVYKTMYAAHTGVSPFLKVVFVFCFFSCFIFVSNQWRTNNNNNNNKIYYYYKVLKTI